MQVGHSTPKIIRLTYRQEQGDPQYGYCLWADFYLDPERGSLAILSDCGNHGFRWPEKGMEFIRLMEGIDSDYLLRKLCEEKKVDVSATVQRLREVLEESEEYTQSQINRYIRYLERTFNDYYLDDSPDLTGHLVTEWCNEHDLDIPDAYEYVKLDYTSDQKRIAEIYEKYIRPIVRESAEGACIR